MAALQQAAHGCERQAPSSVGDAQPAVNLASTAAAKEGEDGADLHRADLRDLHDSSEATAPLADPLYSLDVAFVESVLSSADLACVLLSLSLRQFSVSQDFYVPYLPPVDGLSVIRIPESSPASAAIIPTNQRSSRRRVEKLWVPSPHEPVARTDRWR